MILEGEPRNMHTINTNLHCPIIDAPHTDTSNYGC